MNMTLCFSKIYFKGGEVNKKNAAKKSLDTIDKLSILTRDSGYDLACACARAKEEHRIRSEDDKWVYPATLPNGGTYLPI